MPFGVDDTIVHEYRKVPKHDGLSENSVHHHLKGHWGVSESKEHNSGFKQSFWGKEGCLPLIPRFYTDVIISPPYVKFHE
jgi:hypothetical protein